MSDSFVTPPRTVADQAHLLVGFPRQEYWNGLPFPSPVDLLNPQDQICISCIAGRFFTSESPGKPTQSLGFILFTCPSHPISTDNQNNLGSTTAIKSTDFGVFSDLGWNLSSELLSESGARRGKQKHKNIIGVSNRKQELNAGKWHPRSKEKEQM